MRLKDSYLFLILFIFAFNTELHCQWAIVKTDADSLIRRGSFFIYNMQFDSAEVSFKEVIRRYPDHPAGYFLDAMIEFWKIRIFRDDEKFDNIFLEKIVRAIKVCDNSIGKQSTKQDLTALFFKGGSLGYRGQFYAMRETWWKAAKDGKDGLDILMKCYEIAPGNHDILLGAGIYNYFSVAFPNEYPILNSLMMFLPKGDKELGIQQLKSVAKFAFYSSTEAKVVLLQIYFEFEKNYFEAWKIADELYKTYPRNPYFQRQLGKCLVACGIYDKMESMWRDILLRCIHKDYGYDKYTAREALYYIGICLMFKKDYEKALTYFYKCDEACRFLDKDPSGFMIQLNLKIGNIFDLQGKRPYAIAQYQKVLEWSNNNKSQEEAKRFIQTPYGK